MGFLSFGPLVQRFYVEFGGLGEAMGRRLAGDRETWGESGSD